MFNVNNVTGVFPVHSAPGLHVSSEWALKTSTNCSVQSSLGFYGSVALGVRASWSCPGSSSLSCLPEQSLRLWSWCFSVRLDLGAGRRDGLYFISRTRECPRLSPAVLIWWHSLPFHFYRIISWSNRSHTFNDYFFCTWLNLFSWKKRAPKHLCVVGFGAWSPSLLWRLKHSRVNSHSGQTDSFWEW